MRGDHVYGYPTPDEIAALHRRVRRLRAEAMGACVRHFGRWLVTSFRSGRVAEKAAKAPAHVTAQSC